MKFEGYEVEREVARGGQGIVYVARELQSGRRVALKVLLHADQGLLQRFGREAEVLARLRHPNVVAIHRTGRAQGRPYIEMEFVEGTSLERRISERGPAEPREAARIVRDLARGAGQAHAQGLVHRDIKPANALIRPDGTVLLTDFGLARDQENQSDLSKTGIFMGTPGFASPEQASGEGKRVGPPSDVYGLGALLFALLCARPPVEGDLLEVVVATIDTPAPSPREFNAAVDPTLAAICLRCLAKAPEERYADGSALAAELDRYLAGESLEGTSARAAPLALGLLGLGTVLALGGAGLYAWQPKPEPSLASPTQTPPAQTPRAQTPRAPSPSRTPTPAPTPTPTPDPALERTLRLVRGKTRPEELDSALEILSEALARAEGASNRGPSERHLAALYARRAEQVMRRGPAEVSADLRRAAALDPTPARRAALAEALMREGLLANGDLTKPEHWPRARALLEEAVAFASQDARPPLALGEQARVRKDWPTALRGFEEARRRAPESADAAAGAALVLRKLGRTKEGLVLLRHHLKRYPDQAEVRLREGQLLASQGRWAAARVAYEQVSPERPLARARLGLAWVALEEGRPSLALELSEGVRVSEFEVMAIGGLVDLERGEPGRSVLALRGCLGAPEPDPRLVRGYLQALYRTSQHAKAAEALGELVEARSLPPTQLMFLQADHFVQRDDHAGAGQAFQNLYRALRAHPDAWAALHMGRHFTQWGRYHRPDLAQALARIAAAASSDDEDAGAWILEAKALLLQHRPADARPLLERAREVHPTRVDLHHTWAEVEFEAKRFEDAIAAARRCLKLEPQAIYSAVVGAEACLAAGRYAEAQPLFEVCLPALKDNAAVRSLHAIMKIELGDPEAAVEDVAFAVEREGDLPRTRLARAALLITQGKQEEARELLLPVARRPDRGWAPSYAKALLRRIAGN